METCLEALLKMDFCTKPPNFGVEGHMEAPTGDALTSSYGHDVYEHANVTSLYLPILTLYFHHHIC
jgi:hypothetical protein